MRLLLVFINEPVPGKVHTRLAVDAGEQEAARYYKATVEVMLRQLQGLENCRIRFCYAPDDAGEAIRFWILPCMSATMAADDNLYLAPSSHAGDTLSQEVDFRPQGEGDFGAKLERAFAEGFTQGYKDIAVIGPNSPECGARWINAAFSRLDSQAARDAVIGPTTSGSYYLLVLKSHASELFEDIPWKSENVLSATLSAARRGGLSLEHLPRLGEVVELSDWQNLLGSPLGAALKKALGEPVKDEIHPD